MGKAVKWTIFGLLLFLIFVTVLCIAISASHGWR
jgi:hypothetical protein